MIPALTTSLYLRPSADAFAGALGASMRPITLPQWPLIYAGVTAHTTPLADHLDLGAVETPFYAARVPIAVMDFLRVASWRVTATYLDPGWADDNDGPTGPVPNLARVVTQVITSGAEQLDVFSSYTDGWTSQLFATEQRPDGVVDFYTTALGVEEISGASSWQLGFSFGLPCPWPTDDGLRWVVPLNPVDLIARGNWEFEGDPLTRITTIDRFTFMDTLIVAGDSSYGEVVVEPETYY